MDEDLIKCIVVDDEPLAREVMENFISRVDSLHHVESCSSAYDAFNVINRTQVDLIFLDVHMPELTGLDFLRDLNPMPMVIFTTAYSNHALEAYDLDAIDYLLKPIEFSRFLKSVRKAMQHFRKGTPITIQNEDKWVGTPDYVYIKVEKTIQKILLDDILFIESLKNYVKVKCKEKEITAHKTISSVMEHLPSKHFLRVHRSFIVSTLHIDSFSPIEIEIKGTKIPIGRKYKDMVKERLGYF